jgi:hypothetical protein
LGKLSANAYLLERRLEALQDLCSLVSDSHLVAGVLITHLELNLGLSNVLLASAPISNLLSLRNLVPHSLQSSVKAREAGDILSLTSALKSSIG